MRILFIANTESDPNQGASGCDLATIAALTRQGNRVDTIWGSDMPHRVRHGNLHQLLELPRNYAAAMVKKCRNTHYDVVQVNQPHAFLAAREYKRIGYKGIFVNRSHGWEPNVREAMRSNRAFVKDSRSLVRRCASALMWQMLKRHNDMVVRYSDGLVLCSEDDRDFLLRRYKIDPDRLLALTPGIADFFLENDPPLADLDRYRKILYIGQFAPFKAPDIVARVVNNVLLSVPHAEMSWVCAAQHHEIARSLLHSAVLQRVTFSDWMPREALSTVYDSHGVLLFPSRFEGFSLTFMEAMSRGLCVLASRIDGMRQIIREEENGYLFNVDDYGSITNRLIFILNNPGLCAAIALNARMTSVKYTWDRTAGVLVEFYERLLRRKRS